MEVRVKRRPFVTRNALLQDMARPVMTVRFEDVPSLQAGRYRLMDERLGLDREDLALRMSAVQLWSGECLVVVLAEYAHDDEVRALLIALQQGGFTLANPPLVTVNPTQFSAIARVNWSAVRDGEATEQSPGTPGHVLFCLFDDMLAWALDHGASDLHLGVFEHQNHASVSFTVRGA